MVNYYQSDARNVATPQMDIRSIMSGMQGIQNGLNSQQNILLKQNEEIAKQRRFDQQRQFALEDVANAEQKVIDRNLLTQNVLNASLQQQQDTNVLAGDVNAKYAQLNQAKDFQTQMLKKSYASTNSILEKTDLKQQLKQLDADYDVSIQQLNDQIVAATNATPNLLNQVGNADATSKFKQALLATGQYTPEQAQSIAINKAQEVSPVTSVDQRKAMLEAANKSFDNRVKLIGKSGSTGVSIAEDGSLQINGADKLVNTRTTDPRLIAGLISDLKTPDDWSGRIGEFFGVNTPATRNRLNEYVSTARLAGADDYQIAAALQSSVKDNKFFDDSVDITSDKFTKLALSNATRSNKTTSKDGVGIGGLLSSFETANKSYLDTVDAINKSAYNKPVGKEAIPSMFFKQEGPKSLKYKKDQMKNKKKLKIVKDINKKESDVTKTVEIKNTALEEAASKAFENANISEKDKEALRRVVAQNKALQSNGVRVDDSGGDGVSLRDKISKASTYSLLGDKDPLTAMFGSKPLNIKSLTGLKGNSLKYKLSQSGIKTGIELQNLANNASTPSNIRNEIFKLLISMER